MQIFAAPLACLPSISTLKRRVSQPNETAIYGNLGKGTKKRSVPEPNDPNKVPLVGAGAFVCCGPLQGWDKLQREPMELLIVPLNLRPIPYYSETADVEVASSQGMACNEAV